MMKKRILSLFVSTTMLVASFSISQVVFAATYTCTPTEYKTVETKVGADYIKVWHDFGTDMPNDDAFITSEAYTTGSTSGYTNSVYAYVKKGDKSSTKNDKAASGKVYVTAQISGIDVIDNGSGTSSSRIGDIGLSVK